MVQRGEGAKIPGGQLPSCFPRLWHFLAWQKWTMIGSSGIARMSQWGRGGGRRRQGSQRAKPTALGAIFVHISAKIAIYKQ